MCLLNLNHPSKQCAHSQCYAPTTNQFQTFMHFNNPGVGVPVFRFQDKKRPPIQSISEIMAENLMKKLKDEQSAINYPQEIEKGNTII